MYTLTLIQKDHKTLPVTEKLIILVPLSYNFTLNHDLRLLYKLQGTLDVEKAAHEVPEAAPCIIVSGQLNKANKGKTIIFESIECLFENNGRKIVHMKSDGNCFYRSISYQLLGTQEDCTVCNVATRMEIIQKVIQFSNSWS